METEELKNKFIELKFQQNFFIESFILIFGKFYEKDHDIKIIYKPHHESI